MEKVKAVLAGAGGYGKIYLEYMPEGPCADVELVAVVDPYLEKSPEAREMVKQKQLPVYDSLEEFYQHQKADLAILATPLPMHKEQCITAMANGSHVLCEKPLVPVLQDIPELREAVKKYQKTLSVAFQWDYLPSVLRVKELYARGELGRAVRMKSYISWPRTLKYYSRGWAARAKDALGNYILDSFVTNAVAHYVQVMLYILGDGTGHAEEIASGRGSLYRANDIETYDTAALEMETVHGVKLYFYATHASNYKIDPMFVYEFEQAVVTMNAFDRGKQITIFYRDGRIEELENMGPDMGCVEKLESAVRSARTGKEGPCSIDASLSSLRLANGLLDYIPIREFDRSMVKFDEEQQVVFVPGLHLDLYRCYEQWKLPSELGIPYAVPETEFLLEGYDKFMGTLLK